MSGGGRGGQVLLGVDHFVDTINRGLLTFVEQLRHEGHSFAAAQPQLVQPLAVCGGRVGEERALFFCEIYVHGLPLTPTPVPLHAPPTSPTLCLHLSFF